jgi:hypothetical protein
MRRKIPDTVRRAVVEMAKGTELRRVQAYSFGPVKYLMGDKAIPAGTVARLAMDGFVRPVGKIELGAPLVRYELTDRGEQLAREHAA